MSAAHAITEGSSMRLHRFEWRASGRYGPTPIPGFPPRMRARSGGKCGCRSEGTGRRCSHRFGSGPPRRECALRRVSWSFPSARCCWCPRPWSRCRARSSRSTASLSFGGPRKPPSSSARCGRRSSWNGWTSCWRERNSRPPLTRFLASACWTRGSTAAIHFWAPHSIPAICTRSSPAGATTTIMATGRRWPAWRSPAT